MTALVIILIVLQALTLWVAVAMSKRQKHHIDQLESDLSQADLMLILSGKTPLQHKHEICEENGLLAAIQQALDWAVVGWVL